MSTVTKSDKKKLSSAETERLAVQKLQENNHDVDHHERIIHKVHGQYMSKGFLPVKLRQGTKAPFINNWQQNGNPDANDFFSYYNIGVALGDKSKSKFFRADGEEVEVFLLDIDNDIKDLPEDALDYFLPPTDFKFGRFYNTDKQKLNHRLYRYEDVGVSFKKPAVRLINPTSGKPYSQAVELRTTGGQTMFPGSTIWDEKGGFVDCVMWQGATFDAPEGLPPVVDALDINKRVNLMTLSHLACSQFAEGNFHNSNLGWVGFLLKSGYTRDQVEKSVHYIFNKTGQTDLDSRLADIDSTCRLMEEDETKVAGIKTLLDDAGWSRDVIDNIRKISGSSKQDLDDGRPKVTLIDSKEVQWVDKTLEAMVETKKFYNMDGTTCVVTQENNTAKLQTLTDPTAAASWLTREIMFSKSVLDKSLNQFVEMPTVCPPQIAKDIANISTSKGNLPKLNGVCTHPVVTVEGRIIEDAWKYDPELRLFFACEAEVNGMYPDQATELLKDLVCDFPFEQVHHLAPEEDDEDGEPQGNLVFKDKPVEKMGRYMAAAISGIMTGVCRPVLDICPMYVVSSPQHSDGKSVLSGVIAASVGCEAANGALTKSGNEEEQEKQLCAILLRARPVVVFDNMDGEFRSLPLVEVLTSTHPEFRILGKSETRSIPNKTFFISNGVNHVPALDLQTRSVSIKLARSDLDSYRKFKYNDVVGHTYKVRGDVQSAVISLIKWAQTQPDGDWKPTHRFKMWDRLVRRTMMVIYGVDIAPPISEDSERVMDPKEEVRGMFLRYLKHCWDIGVRDKTSKGKERAFFRAKTISDRIVDGSDEDDWLCVLSGKSKMYSINQRVGFTLGGVRGVPFEENGEIYRLTRYEVEKASAYKIEVRRSTVSGGYFWV